MSNIFFGLHCPECGKRIEESESFCVHCGTDLDAPLEKDNLEALAQQYLQNAQKNFDRRLIEWALADCEKVLEYMPEMAEAHNLRGLILDEKGKADEALSEYREAVRLKPDYADAIANLEDAEAEYRHIQQEKAKKQGMKIEMNFRLFLTVVSIGVGIQLILFFLLGALNELQEDEAVRWFKLLYKLVILGTTIVYLFLTGRDKKIATLSGSIAGLSIAAVISFLFSFPMVLYILFSLGEMKSLISQNSIDEFWVSLWVGLILFLNELIANIILGAIGGAFGVYLVNTVFLGKKYR